MDLKTNVYVRCPILDREYIFDPRDFIVGRIVSIDEYADMLLVWLIGVSFLKAPKLNIKGKLGKLFAWKVRTMMNIVTLCRSMIRKTCLFVKNLK